MVKSFGNADLRIADYAEKTFQPEDPVLREVRERAAKAGLPLIQLGPMDALHLEVITRAVGAKKAIEIGTLAGYSGISLLRGLGKDGKLFCFEYSPLHAKVAQESFKKAGFEKSVKIYVGPAIENLPKVNSKGPFDLIFIDADKESYPAYLEWAKKNLKKGGLIVADNTFAFGKIADHVPAPEHEKDVVALRKFNDAIARDASFRATILPTGEGITIAVKVK